MLNRENAIQSLNNNQFKELGDKIFYIKIKELPFVKKIKILEKILLNLLEVFI